MAYIRTIVHYYMWEGGGHEEERYFIIKDFINRGGGEGSKPLMNSSLNIPYFFFEVVPNGDSIPASYLHFENKVKNLLK